MTAKCPYCGQNQPCPRGPEGERVKYGTEEEKAIHDLEMRAMCYDSSAILQVVSFGRRVRAAFTEHVSISGNVVAFTEQFVAIRADMAHAGRNEE